MPQELQSPPIQISEQARNAEANSTCALMNGGFLRIYSEPEPLRLETPLAGQILLAEFRFGTPAFHPAVDGAASAMPIRQEDSARATARAGFFRSFTADGTTAVLQGTVGREHANLLLNTVNIERYAIVQLRSLTYVRPAAPEGQGVA